MMRELLRRGEQAARIAQQRRLREIAAQLSARFAAVAVAIEGDAVVVRGRGLIKRWLVEPGLRFLTGARP